MGRGRWRAAPHRRLSTLVALLLHITCSGADYAVLLKGCIVRVKPLDVGFAVCPGLVLQHGFAPEGSHPAF